MLKTETGIAKSPNNACRHLYEKYGAMLFGFLLEALGDRNLAETYLIDIFAELATGSVSTNNCTWLQLRRIAREKLNISYAGLREIEALAAGLVEDRRPSDMTAEQRYVFFHLYKCGRPVAIVSREMDLPQARVCKILAEAFTLIRKS
jgi:hypothetical protein